MNLGHITAEHTLPLTLVIVALASLGLPMPVSLVLLAAGAASVESTHVSLSLLLPLIWVVAIAADTLLYLGGRYTGWWLLAWLCRLTTNPEQCIFRSSDYFYRRGARTLLFARFIPGFGAMAAPLAGSLNMRLSRFLRLDAFGAILYTSTWTLTGLLFSSYIRSIERVIARAGHVMLSLIGLVAVGYAITWVIFALKTRRFKDIERVDPLNLHERLQQEDPDRVVVIADVRSHGYYDPGMQRIKNSIRVEPHRLEEELIALREFMAPECEIYLYCSCIREATSVRVAYMMTSKTARQRSSQAACALG